VGVGVKHAHDSDHAECAHVYNFILMRFATVVEVLQDFLKVIW